MKRWTIQIQDNNLNSNRHEWSWLDKSHGMNENKENYQWLIIWNTKHKTRNKKNTLWWTYIIAVVAVVVVLVAYDVFFKSFQRNNIIFVTVIFSAFLWFVVFSAFLWFTKCSLEIIREINEKFINGGTKYFWQKKRFGKKLAHLFSTQWLLSSDHVHSCLFPADDHKYVFNVFTEVFKRCLHHSKWKYKIFIVSINFLCQITAN